MFPIFIFDQRKCSFEFFDNFRDHMEAEQMKQWKIKALDPQ